MTPPWGTVGLAEALAVALGTLLSWRHRFVVLCLKIVFNALRLTESRAEVNRNRKEDSQDLCWLEAGRREGQGVGGGGRGD